MLPMSVLCNPNTPDEDASTTAHVTIVIDLDGHARPLFVSESRKHGWKDDWFLKQPAESFEKFLHPSPNLANPTMKEAHPYQTTTKLSDDEPIPVTRSDYKTLGANYPVECIERGRQVAEVALETLNKEAKDKGQVNAKVIDASGIQDVYDEFPEIPVIPNRNS
ncbi:uncharacterized protein L203_105289 [Cryptococcus depauperatus CBS 7841]|uniref:Uncharacterized protein n=1 Tax=Cryptococcus depauperatus CBS 7841 TaxID=1295531 RepID=A0A1E3I0Q9_9TREE|nr:hypothetical protein L203_05660 [Cryptococcus depauperatus CBS 7841]